MKYTEEKNQLILDVPSRKKNTLTPWWKVLMTS